MIAMKRLFVCL